MAVRLEVGHQRRDLPLRPGGVDRPRHGRRAVALSPCRNSPSCSRRSSGRLPFPQPNGCSSRCCRSRSFSSGSWSVVSCSLVFVAARRPIRRTAETLRTAAIASVFLFVGYVAQTVGMRYTTASNSAFITALYVVLVPLFLRRFDLPLWTALSYALSGFGLP